MDEFKIYACDVCGWEYNEEEGCPDEDIEAGTKWEDIPAGFKCPICGVPKEKFSEQSAKAGQQPAGQAALLF